MAICSSVPRGGHEGGAGRAVQGAVVHGARLRPAPALVAGTARHDAAAGRCPVLQVEPHLPVRLEQAVVQHHGGGERHVPVAGGVDEQQLAVGQAHQVADPADEVPQTGERGGTVVVEAGNADAGLLQRQPGGLCVRCLHLARQL